MKVSTACLIFVLVLSCLHAIHGLNENQEVYVKSVFCNANEKFVDKNYKCFAKSYSRTVSTLNIIFNYKKLMSSVKVTFRVLYKYGQIFRDVFIPVALNWCDIMESRNRNKIVKELLNFMELSAPGTVHDCPYDGVNIRNSTLRADGLMSIWPSGEYRMEIFSATTAGEYLHDVNVTAVFKTPLKVNF